MNLKELVNQTREILEEGVLTIWIYKQGRSWGWKIMEDDDFNGFELLSNEKQNEMIEQLKKETDDVHGLKLNGYNDLANYSKSALYHEIGYRYESYKAAEMKEEGKEYESKFNKKRNTKNTFKCLAKLKDENGKYEYYIMESSKNESKIDFIRNLRGNGFKVDTKKIKRKEVYDFIINHTNCDNYIWEIMYTEKDIEEYKKDEFEFTSRKFNAISRKRRENYYNRFGWRYTYTFGGYSAGNQPETGFKEFENSIMHKYGVITYTRQLSQKEIDVYGLKDLNII